MVVILGLQARCRFKDLIEAFWQLWSQQGKHHLSPATCGINARKVYQGTQQAQRNPAFLLPSWSKKYPPGEATPSLPHSSLSEGLRWQ